MGGLRGRRIALCVVACASVAAAAVLASAAAQPAAPARTVQVARPRILPAEDEYPATLYVENDVRVAARASGVIAKVLVDRGARVRTGQALAELETDVAAHELEIAEHELRFAQEERDRLSALRDKEIVSAQDFRRVDIARDLAASKADLARAWLERCTIRAPFDGVVVERWAQLGQHIMEDDGTPLFRVVGSQALRARVNVPEDQMSRWAIGAPARVSRPGGLACAARVVFASPAVDAASATGLVIVELGERRDFLPGASVQVRSAETAANSQPTFLLPAEALASDAPGAAAVFVADNGVARKRAVSVLGRREGGVKIRGALGASDLVILAAGDLADGAPVRVAREAP